MTPIMRRSRKKDDGDRSASGEAASRKDDLRGSRSQLVFLLVLGCCIAGLAGALIMFRYRSHGNSRGMLSAVSHMQRANPKLRFNGRFLQVRTDGMPASCLCQSPCIPPCSRATHFYHMFQFPISIPECTFELQSVRPFASLVPPQPSSIRSTHGGISRTYEMSSSTLTLLSLRRAMLHK